MTAPLQLPEATPDWWRARIRTGAQVIGGFLIALLGRWLLRRFGIVLDEEEEAALRNLVDVAALVVSTVTWMVLVKTLTALHPTFDRLNILRGTPAYPGTVPVVELVKAKGSTLPS
jgi:hypothetical protein